MRSLLVVGVVVVAPEGDLFKWSVHAFDLAVGRGLIGLGELVIDGALSAGRLEDMCADSLGRRFWAIYLPAVAVSPTKADSCEGLT